MKNQKVNKTSKNITSGMANYPVDFQLNVRIRFYYSAISPVHLIGYVARKEYNMNFVQHILIFVIQFYIGIFKKHCSVNVTTFILLKGCIRLKHFLLNLK